MSGHRVYIDKQSPTVYQGLTKAAAELRARAADAGLSRTTLELVNIGYPSSTAASFALTCTPASPWKRASRLSGSPCFRCGRRPSCSAMWSVPP